MGLRGKLMGGNSKVLPGLPMTRSVTLNRSPSWDSDDSTSAGAPTPCSLSTRSGSVVSNRPTPRGGSGFHTPRVAAQRRRPVTVGDPASPTSSSSKRSSVDPPVSPWTRAAPFDRRGGRGRIAQNDLSHLIAPVQPWNEFIEGYSKNITEKVGGDKKAWMEVLSLNNNTVRKALALNMITPRGSNKPRQMPQEISDILIPLVNSIPPSFRTDTAKLTFALHERPHYCTALSKHVELVLWGIVAARNDWM